MSSRTIQNYSGGLLVLMRSSPPFGDAFCQKSGKTATCRGLVNTTAGLLSAMLSSPCSEGRIQPGLCGGPP